MDIHKEVTHLAAIADGGNFLHSGDAIHNEFCKMSLADLRATTKAMITSGHVYASLTEDAGGNAQASHITRMYPSNWSMLTILAGIPVNRKETLNINLRDCNKK